MIAILDYGAGNLFSLHSSLTYLGIESQVTRDPEAAARADRIIVPGVGAFEAAIAALRAAKLDLLVKEQAALGKPVLGICLGMQLLFEGSLEYGRHTGLGLLPGWVRPLSEDVNQPVKIPHMGWNSLRAVKPCPILKNTSDGAYVYYVHSFYAPAGAAAAGVTRYGGVDITGVAQLGSVYGCQFHPEKSGDIGLGMLKAFDEILPTA